MDDTHPAVGMSTRFCLLSACFFWVVAYYLTQQSYAQAIAHGEGALSVYHGFYFVGAFFGIKGWIKWLRS